MKKAMTTLLISTALTSFLVACSQSDDCDNKAATGSQKIMTDSNQLTAAGEHLMDRDHWMQADTLFVKALEKNPNDLKAQFYHASLKPFLVTKGLATRVKPFIRQNGDIKGYEAALAKIPDSPSKAFALDGKEDITSIEEVQRILVEQRQAFSDLRQFLKTHEDMELTLNSPELQGRKMNSADLIVLRQAVAGIIVNYNLVTNYSADGAEKISKQLEQSNLTNEQIHHLIASVPTIGKLRQDQGFSDILNMGADLSSAVKWALQYQDRLCAGGPEVKNRPGYVLEYGVCIENKDQAQRDFALLDEALKGPFETVLKTSGETKTTTLDIRSFLNKPVSDLRTIAPASYSACGHVTALTDQSVGGLFPHADAEEFLPSFACVH